MDNINPQQNNGNGHAPDYDPAKRERSNTLRRINRRLLKENRKMVSVVCGDSERRLFLVDLLPINGVEDLTSIARKVGAVDDFGICAICRPRRQAWHQVEGLSLCDGCAAEVRS